MNQMTDNLIQLSDNLDKAGKLKCANLVDDLIKNQSVTKVAQYVGVIGYVLKQHRAMNNCVRKKRVESSTSMQEVILDCIKEYQDGQSYGNNEWTSKYAQVIEQTPEHLESSGMDFLASIAEENQIGEHVGQMKNAHKELEANGFGETIISSILSDLNALFMEGDAAHRPFKVAAPQSQRGFWNRFWSPSWTRRGQDKDTRYEMDNVAESIANISSSVQQIRSNISRLRYMARTMPNDQLVQNINSLSATDWNETIARMQNISQMLNTIRVQNPSSDVFQTAEILSDVASNVQNIYDQGSRIQRNMYNLRQRDPVKGRGSNPAATAEYADLERALGRLYENPLDEKSLYYSQKLHGRLEDTLNMRPTKSDSGYGEWADEPMEHPQEVPGVIPNAAPDMPQDQSNLDSQENTSQSIADNMRQLVTDESGNVDERALERVVSMLKGIMRTDVTPHSRTSINELIDALQSPVPIAPAMPQTVQTPETVKKPYNPATFGEVDWDEVDWSEEKSLVATLDIKTLYKMADEAEPLDADLAKLLHEYLEQEELLPTFPETSPILKEEAASRLKITQKKGGKVVLNT